MGPLRRLEEAVKPQDVFTVETKEDLRDAIRNLSGNLATLRMKREELDDIFKMQGLAIVQFLRKRAIILEYKITPLQEGVLQSIIAICT